MLEKKDSLGHMPEPGAPWKFDESVTECFDDMLERSIPSYRRMRELIFRIGERFVKPRFEIVDLGASRGESVDGFIKRHGAHNHFTLVEVSPPMLEVLRARYEHYESAKVVHVTDTDLRTDYPPVNACLTLCVLTLQFTPIEHRLQILNRIYENTIPDGALIVVEKLLGGSPKMDKLFSDCYYQFKKTNGYSYEEIDRKKLSLEGALVPVSEEYNKNLLGAVGFKSVETFWRDTNFAGFVAIK